MKNFWQESWSTIDPQRVNAYIEASASFSEPVIEYLKRRGAKTVCDAGCGCGAYSLRLALNGFEVSGFDISPIAAEMSKQFLESKGFCGAEFRAADILATGYDAGRFDAVLSRDVIDHMPLKDGIAAVQELFRIVKDGGAVIITLDRSDGEYEAEPHTVNADGDYLFSGGRWDGMVFHPYSEEQLSLLAGAGTVERLEAGEEGFVLFLSKNARALP